ncbi:MAG: hypothetical protein AAGJ18_01275 [Bacteroidota bacterium]
MKKRCLVCNEEFNGRADKKYCSPNCRSTAHNHLNRDAINFVRNINNILGKNRRILSILNPDGKAKVHKDKLLAEGFNFSYFTNIYRTQKGNTYYFCYDYGYLALSDGEYYTLVRRQSYVA